MMGRALRMQPNHRLMRKLTRTITMGPQLRTGAFGYPADTEPAPFACWSNARQRWEADAYQPGGGHESHCLGPHDSQRPNCRIDSKVSVSTAPAGLRVRRVRVMPTYVAGFGCASKYASVRCFQWW